MTAQDAQPDFEEFTKDGSPMWAKPANTPSVTINAYGQLRFGTQARKELAGSGAVDDMAYVRTYVDRSRGLVGFEHVPDPTDSERAECYKAAGATISISAILGAFGLDPPDESVVLTMQTDDEIPHIDLREALRAADEADGGDDA